MPRVFALYALVYSESDFMAWVQRVGLIDMHRYVREFLLISFTPRLSRRRRRSRNVPPFLYPTFAATSSTLALLVFKRWTTRSTRRLWKYDIGDFPRTLCSLRVSVLLLAPTAFAALSRENPRASLVRAQRSKSCTSNATRNNLDVKLEVI